MGNDKDGNVRKYVSMNLKYFIALLPEAPEKELISLLKNLFNDEKDYVKTFNCDSFLELCRKIDPKKIEIICQPFFINLQNQES